MTVAELIDFLGQFPGEYKVMVKRTNPVVLDLLKETPGMISPTVRVEAQAVEINREHPLEVMVS